MTQTATTTRRTAKITAVYTAIKMHIENAAPDGIVHCQAKSDMKIAGTNGASVELKAGEWFYLVASDSLGADMWYIVREVSGVKKCSCPARKPCKHEIKVAAKRQVVEVVPAEQSVEAVIEAAMEAFDASEAVPVVPEVAGVTRKYTRDEYLELHQRNKEWQQAEKARDREALAEAAMLASPLNGNTGYSLFRR